MKHLVTKAAVRLQAQRQVQEFGMQPQLIIQRHPDVTLQLKRNRQDVIVGMRHRKQKEKLPGIIRAGWKHHALIVEAVK